MHVTSKQKISENQLGSTSMLKKNAWKITYFPQSGGGFHADRIVSDLALDRQFLKTIYFVVNREMPTSL